MSSKLVKKTKKSKNPINREKGKNVSKSNLKQKQNQKENLKNKQQDQQITNNNKKKGTITNPKLFDLSGKVLCQYQIKVICKGLKFTSIPLPNKTELRNDVQQFSRKLSWLEIFLPRK